MQNPSMMITSKMEVLSLQPTLSTCLSPSNLVKKGFFYGQFPKICNPKKYPGSRKLQVFHIRAQQPPGDASLSSATVEATSQNVNSKDEDTVFVAGATGRVGSRTVRELLKLGFRVRAGVRSAQRAESLVRSVRQMKLDTDATSGVQAIEKLEIVECDLESNQIVPALGRASVVICCIGASEKEIFDVTGPYRIDYQATKNLIDAATVAKVDHFILLTSLGTNKVGFPAAILNLFWGVLLWKRKAEEALIDSGLPYTIVRPGGMERPTDSFKETHNLVLSPEDTLFGGLVSNLQVAELMAFMTQNRELSYCKIVEAVAETTAPLTPTGELLANIPPKRAYIYKAKKPEPADRAETLPPKITVTEEAKDRELSEEKSLEPEPEPLKSSMSDVPTSLTGKEIAEEKSVAPRPLSPYAAYEDLKPPSSPSPTPPIPEEKKVEIADVAPEILQKKQPLSPYAAYEDLKPPTSPSPSTPTSFRETLKTVDDVPEVMDGTLINRVPQEPTFYHSPFPVYDDLKPPTSPTPRAPNSTPTPTPTPTHIATASANDESQIATTSNEDAVETLKGDVEAGDVENSTEPKPRPLSPYTMYDDMKPPTSPTPSQMNH